MAKGTFGYINAYKKRYGTYMAILAVCIAGGLLAVFLIFGTLKHLAVLIPVILSIPFAKMLTLWVIVVRFRSMDPEDVETLEQGLDRQRHPLVLYDMAFSSYESVSFASCVVLQSDRIYLLWGGSNEKTYDEKMQCDYIQDLVKRSGCADTVVTVHSVSELLERIHTDADGAETQWEDGQAAKQERLKRRLLDICV